MVGTAGKPPVRVTVLGAWSFNTDTILRVSKSNVSVVIALVQFSKKFTQNSNRGLAVAININCNSKRSTVAIGITLLCLLPLSMQ